jgi:hypothetical protein
MAHDNYADRELHRLRAQLSNGSHLRVYHHGVSPAFSFSPNEPSRASQVRHELAQSLVDAGYLDVVESGSTYNVYSLPARKIA